MRTYVASAPFAYTKIFTLHCPYCEKTYIVRQVQQETIAVKSTAGYPSKQDVLNEAHKQLEKQQQALRAAFEAGRYVDAPEGCICPDCGFVPAFLIRKGRYRAIQIGLAVIAFFLVGSCLFLSLPAAEADRGLLCGGAALLPFLILIGLMEIQMRPNRKLVRKARAEGRTLDLDVKPELSLSSIHPVSTFPQPPG